MSPKSVWGSIFKHLGIPKFAKTYFLSKTNLFKTNYSKPFQETHLDLAYRVDLKHRDSILKFEKSSIKF